LSIEASGYKVVPLSLPRGFFFWSDDQVEEVATYRLRFSMMDIRRAWRIPLQFVEGWNSGRFTD
jgi:hypothetical protein